MALSAGALWRLWSNGQVTEVAQVAVASPVVVTAEIAPPPPSEDELPLFVWPVPGTDVTSPFGRREDPVDGEEVRKHRGIDVRCPRGTPVLATLDGEVASARWSPGSGLTIRLKHAQEISSLYAHLSRIDVRPGIRVRAGQQIGLSGATGRVTGPHLHFEIRRRAKSLNPLRFLYRRAPLSPDEAAASHAEARSGGTTG